MKRRDEVLVGLLVTVAVVVTILGTLFLARGGLSAGYPLHTRFNWGQGLKQGQPVLLAGANVGYVSEIKFRQEGWLDATYRIKDEFQIPDGTTATVEPNGIFGDQMIVLTPSTPTNTFYAPGDTIPAGRPSATIQQLIARMDTVGSSVKDVATAIELELVQQGGIADLRRSMTQASRLMGQLSAIAAEQSRQISATMTSLRRSASALDSSVIDSTMRSLQASSANMAALTGDLRTTTTQLNTLLGRLDRGEGTAGKLLTDTLLYRDVRSLVTRLDSLSLDFQRNPRRYINLEIF